jgi:hypothetical protein
MMTSKEEVNRNIEENRKRERAQALQAMIENAKHQAEGRKQQAEFNKRILGR